MGSSSRHRIWLTLNGLNSGGSILASFTASNPGNNSLSLDDAGTTIYNTFVEGYWSLTDQNGFKLGGANTYDLQLDGNGFTSFPIDADTRILTRADAAGNWTAEGTHVAGIGTTAKRSGLTTFGAEYALGDDTNCSRPTTSAITGVTDVCTGQTGVTYSVTDNSPNTYTWTITGGTQAGGGNTHSITVDWGSTGAENASVQVVETNSCTNGAPVVLPVTIHSVPPDAISGKTSIAENTSGVSYSVTARTGYTYNWIITGGTQASGGNSNSITVDWGSAGTGTVSVVAELPGCNPASAVSVNVRKYVIIESAQSGKWDDPNTWDCSCVPLATDNVRIKNTHTVSLPNGSTAEINNFIIDPGGTLDYNNKNFIVHGDFIVNGTYSGNSGRNLTLAGTDKEIDGVGTIIGGMNISSGNKTISSTAVLDVVSGDISIGSNITVTNNGAITIDGDVTGSAASSIWINDDNSILEIGGALLSTGTLDASGIENVVNYYGS